MREKSGKIRAMNGEIDGLKTVVEELRDQLAEVGLVQVVESSCDP